MSYLKWLKQQKVEFFEMLVSRRLPIDVCADLTLDWANPRLICIAESFSKYDVDTVEVVPIRIELLTYRYYDGDIFGLEQLNVVSGAQAFVTSAARVRPAATGIVSEIADAPGDGEVTIASGSNQTRSLFRIMRDRILALGPDIVERPRKGYVAFRATMNFAEVYLQRTQVKMRLRPIDYKDPLCKIERLSDKARQTMDRVIGLSSEDDLEYVMNIIEQSYRDTT